MGLFRTVLPDWLKATEYEAFKRGVMKGTAVSEDNLAEAFKSSSEKGIHLGAWAGGFSKASGDRHGRKRLQQNGYFQAGACRADQCWSRSGEQESPPLEGCWVQNDQGKCPEPGSPKGERGRGGGQTTWSLQFLTEFTLRTLWLWRLEKSPQSPEHLESPSGQVHKSPQQL